MPELIICDMDGVILDSMGFLRELGIRTIMNGYKKKRGEAVNIYDSTVGMPFHHQLESVFPNNMENAFSSTKYHNVHLEMAQYLPLVKGISRELILSLKPNTALITSTTKNILMESLSQVLELGFGLVASFPPTKEEQIEAALKSFGSSSHNTLYIGDSPFDKMLADELGLQYFNIVNPNKDTAEILSCYTKAEMSPCYCCGLYKGQCFCPCHNGKCTSQWKDRFETDLGKK